MPEQKWSVEVDPEACIGSGMCIVTAPDRFRLAGTRARSVDEGEIEPDDVVLDAAEACPAEAIWVREAATGRVLAPEV